jgi:hypothetical protein
MRPCPFSISASLTTSSFCQNGVEIIGDLGFERWLIALEGEQVVSLVFNDLIGDGDLTAHSVDGHQRSFELFGFGHVVEKFRNGRDFILGHAELSEDEPGIGRIGAQSMERLESLALVVGTARRLAVDGDQIMPAGPELLDPALKTAPEQQRIEA